ncbi:MAG TPA: GNAT family N-acetyltransferase, partial [Stellaceae bacterium]|nr:GNAT family N-acetyltransferase [Stellaceae bacterium]
GLGGRLMRAAEAWLQERGIRKVELMIRDTNTEVTAFYVRLGYGEEPVKVMSRWLDGTKR